MNCRFGVAAKAFKCSEALGANTSQYEAPNTHTVEDFWVSVHSEMMHLTFKRQKAPVCLEVRWGGGVGTSTWRQANGEEVWDEEQSVRR